MNRINYILINIFLFVVIGSLNAEAQKFYNLKAEDIAFKDRLPRLAYTFPLKGNYQDSVYTVKIKYPEFMDMSKVDISKYRRITSSPLPELPELNQRIVMDRKNASLEVLFTPMVQRNKKLQFLVSFMLEVQSKPIPRKVTRARPLAVGTRTLYAEKSVLSSGRWAKIRVPATGLYQITDELARRAGFSNAASVKVYGYGGNLQNETLQKEDLMRLDDLKQVPTCEINGKKVFYGRGPVSWTANFTLLRTRNPYSDYGYYFLTENDAPASTLTKDEFLKSFYPSPNDYHELHEIDNFAWYQGGRNLFENTPINLGQTQKYVMPVANSQAQSYTCRVSLTSNVSSTAVVFSSSNKTERRVHIFFPDEYFKANEASVSWETKAKGAKNDTIYIRTLSGGPIRLDNISITYDKPKPAPNLDNMTFAVPEYVHNITNQNLHGDGPADMVVIIPASQKLLGEARRLADFHEKHDHMRVKIVPADELFNEFSSGTPDANAYRRYLRMLYDRAKTEKDMPKYLLLFGDCAWDNRMKVSDWQKSNPDDYLLCYESEDSYNEVYCYVDDGWFCLLDDGEGGNPVEGGKLDVAVGRFPVSTPEEAKVMVDKTIGYVLNKNAGAWQNMLVFMGDDGNQNIHMRDVNIAAEKVAQLYPKFQIKKVMWDAYERRTSATGNTYPEITTILKRQQEAGALIMDYGGHGRAEELSHERVLTLKDFEQFTNKNLPLWITASCDIMPFDGSVPTIGEAAVLNPKGGAVAFYGTTRTVWTDRNKLMNVSFLKNVLGLKDGRAVPLGEAVRMSKNSLVEDGLDLTTNRLQYSLLGDPAIALNVPTMNVVIDKIQGVDVRGGEGVPTLKAGSVATIEGHIQDAKDFNGIVSITVRDKEERVVCRLNNTTREGADEPFTYVDRTKVLFQGSDSVKNGQFRLIFAVPKDIDYAEGSGLATLYAVNNEHTLTANGSCDKFNIGGSVDAPSTGIGPSLYCYLNMPSFKDGGRVNPTPTFVAEIKDEDGINTSGSSVGHDLQLSIDNNPSMTYNLNEYFNFDFGSYKSGKVYFSIPRLSPGKHTLVFRAWDVYNNSSVSRLSFEVVEGMSPDFVNVHCTTNPAANETTFIVMHDRPGTLVDATFELFDLMGRRLWKHKVKAYSEQANFAYSWNLCTDDGSQLKTGVYLYRVTLGENGATRTSKAKKLIVINNN